VVVCKEADERVETVRDTVRQTKVDVHQGTADRPIEVGGATSSNRKP
jgi:hypothetical protein